MLPGMQNSLGGATLSQCLVERQQLNELGAGANDAEGTLAGVARAPVAATLLPAQLFALGGGGCHRLACITDLPTCPMVCLACAGARSR